ncbi:MAG TPA: hypothetical protein VF735_02275 [Pyrinomonadaceae bacterium]|jgi:peptidoglycan hydrolase CwlO-like protein
MANEDAVKAAMSDPKKQSRIAKFLTTLAGQNFTPILNAINGGDQDFTQQLAQVQANVAKVNQLQQQVNDRQQQIDTLTTQINQLRSKVTDHEKTISELEAKIPNENPF